MHQFIRSAIVSVVVLALATVAIASTPRAAFPGGGVMTGTGPKR
jgi:hypothetical protein